MVDLDKFICSMIWHSTSGGLIRQCLKDQGLEYKDGKLVEINKPSTIKFNEPDIDAMVDEYKRKMGYKDYLFTGRYEVDSYKQGLKDMYRKIKGE